MELKVIKILQKTFISVYPTRIIFILMKFMEIITESLPF